MLRYGKVEISNDGFPFTHVSTVTSLFRLEVFIYPRHRERFVCVSSLVYSCRPFLSCWNVHREPRTSELKPLVSGCGSHTMWTSLPSALRLQTLPSSPRSAEPQSLIIHSAPPWEDGSLAARVTAGIFPRGLTAGEGALRSRARGWGGGNPRTPRSGLLSAPAGGQREDEEVQEAGGRAEDATTQGQPGEEEPRWGCGQGRGGHR